MELYKNLLNQVGEITKRYEKINELTGENFNVFRILKLESSEVRMHSAFLAELLNPKGSHGQKDAFLKLFVDAFCFKKNSINTASCRVKVEDHIGLISEDGENGGRIDIIIRDTRNNSIIIENKIYAGDQKHQLTQYFNYANNADIIYLTLDGKQPSDDSRGTMILDEHFKCYSYERDILSWLEKCRKEVAIYPIVREALTHYINLVKHLTNQTINHNMEEEISNLLKSNLEAAWVISSNLNKACQKVADSFGEDLVIYFKEKGLKCSCDINFSNRFTGIYIWKDDWKHLSISFRFEQFDKRMIYGFLRKEPYKYKHNDVLIKILNALPNNTGNGTDYWPWYQSMESAYANWNQIEAWKAISNGKMKESIIEKTNELLTLIEMEDIRFDEQQNNV